MLPSVEGGMSSGVRIMFLPGLARFLGSGQASLLLFRTFCLLCAVCPPSIRGSRPMLQYRIVLRTPRVTSACLTSVCRLISTWSLGSQVPLSRVGSLPGVAPSGPWTVCQLSSLLKHWLLPFAMALVNLEDSRSAMFCARCTKRG